jgi:hypothetical protein
MSTTWNGTASNQLVTRQALQNAIDTGALGWNPNSNAFIPNTNINICVNYLSATSYVNIPSLIGSDTRVIPKSSYTGISYTINIAGRVDGANMTLFIAFPIAGAYSKTISNSVCAIIGGGTSTSNAGTATLFITAGSFGGTRYKFYLVEGGITCPSSGTQYNDYPITTPLTRNYNFFVVPVWTGTAYVPV